MFTVAISQSFIAQHFLIGGDWGAENELHSHHYRVEVILEGAALDQHGYLVDIVEMETALARLVERYRDKTLNELPEFQDLNPSIERLAGFIQASMVKKLQAPNLTSIAVKVWENERNWAGCRQELP